MSSRFDRFMVSNGIGTNRKLRRLPVVQRWTYVAGVLSLASQSPLRGALLITDGTPATVSDVAAEATVTLAQARAALDSLRALGMLERDEHGVEWVHDWDLLNPAPKPSDSPEAARDRKRKSRAKERGRHADVTRSHADVTPMSRDEEEVEAGKRTTPFIPKGKNPELDLDVVDDVDPGASLPRKPTGNRKRDLAVFDEQVRAYAAARFPDLPEAERSGYTRAALSDSRNPTHESVEEYVRRWLTPERPAAKEAAA